jgi:hypothetical protein
MITGREIGKRFAEISANCLPQGIGGDFDFQLLPFIPQGSADISFFHVPGADELKRSEDISFWVLAGRMRMFPAGRGTPQKEILIILAQARDNEEKRQRL